MSKIKQIYKYTYSEYAVEITEHCGVMTMGVTGKGYYYDFRTYKN